MATRTDEPLTVHGGLEGDDARKAEKIREDIAETRNHMARTVDAIEDRLSPKNIKAQVSSVKSHLLEEVSSTKTKLLDEVTSTKTKLLDEIKDVKSTVKTEVSHELQAAKAKVREQTIGRVENMVHGARDITMNAGSTTIDTVKTNPIPAALVAVGLGWLIVSSMKSKKATTFDSRIRARSFDGVDEDGYAYSYDQGVAQSNADSFSDGPRRVLKRGRRAVSNVGQEISGKASNVASSAKTAITGAANTVADKAEHLAHDASTLANDAGHRVGDAAHRVGDAALQAKRKAGMVARNAGMKGRRVARNAGTQVRRAEQGFERELRSNPLAFGALAVAVGAAIGLLLPATEVEDRLVGEKKDLLLDNAKERFGDFAQQAISTVQEKAGEITSNLKNDGPDTKPQGHQNGLSHSNGLSNGYSNGLSNGLSKHV